MADAAATPALEAQRAANPDLGEQIDLLQKYTNAKLYHQLTGALLTFLESPAFAPSKAGAAAALTGFFNGFIKDFEKKFDPVKWVQILAIVSKPQTPEAALETIQPFEEGINSGSSPSAKYLLQALKGEKMTMAGKLDDAKEILDNLGTEIENAYEVDALIQSNFHKTNALLWQKLERYPEYYRSSILFMAYTPVANIPTDQRAKLAFDVGVAALIAADVYDFAELLQQDLISSLDGTEFEWIKDVLQAFGEGKFDMYDAALQKHSAKIKAVPLLAGAAESTILRPKMAVLAMMELAFRKPKKQRRMNFKELAEHCRVEPKGVEHAVMKAMSNELIKGQIDQVQEIVMVSWVKPRILDTVRIDLMRERMDAWAAQTGLLLEHLEEMTPELLVS